MFLIVLIFAIGIFGYAYWMILIDRCKDVVVEIAKQVARSKGVEVVYTGTMSENRMKNIRIIDRFLRPGFTFEIRNKRTAHEPGKISVLNNMEKMMYLNYLNNELEIDSRIQHYNLKAEIADSGMSSQRCRFVVCPRKINYNKKRTYGR